MDKGRFSSRVQLSFIVVILLAVMGAPSYTSTTKEELIPAIAIPGTTPSMCIDAKRIDGRGGEEAQECPKNHAMYWIGDDGGKERSGRRINVSSSCCPLPSDDILSEQHVLAAEECPEDYIATGAVGQSCTEKFCPVLMRCTKVNTSRYALAETREAKYWGNGHAGWQNSQRTEREEIPIAIRNAVGRQANGEIDVDGCVGYPWGSLLTKKTSKYCYGYGFRQLTFSGAPGDPLAGTPVQMFPDCASPNSLNTAEREQCIMLNKKLG